MNPHAIRRGLVVAALGGAALAAHSQPASPPIKPGLWEIKMATMTDGKAAPDMSERMKSLPPEARANMEAMMKQRGVDMGGGHATRICQTREKLDKGSWRDQSDRCKATTSGQGTSTWKWNSVCTNPDSVTDGEATFANAENYTMKNTIQTTRDGQQHVMQMSGTAKWMGADCGDLKPVQAPSAKKDADKNRN